MHETGVVRRLLDAATLASDGKQIRRMSLRIGALTGFSEEVVERHVLELAAKAWGHEPEVIVSTGGDPADSGALGVTLESIAVVD